MHRDLILFGLVWLLVGLGGGFYIYTHLEGLDPDWPLWMAMLAPLLFVLAGLHMVAAGFGKHWLAGKALVGIMIGLWVIVHWGAIFSKNIQCVQTVSFLGLPLLERYPSESECRTSLRVILATVDALILLAVVAFWFRERRRSQSKPAV